MADFITIEEINSHIDNAVNMNNANTHAYNANQHAYNSNTNASKCNQILSNVYHTNGDTKKSWHLYIINQTLTSLDTTPFQLTNIYLHGLTCNTVSGSTGAAWNLYLDDNLFDHGNSNFTLLQRGALLQFANLNNATNLTNLISQGWTASLNIPVANLYINASIRTNIANLKIMYSIYE